MILPNELLQVPAPFDNLAGPDRQFSMDQWSGYPAALERLSKAIADHAANRTVVMTGDIHSNWVNDLRARNDRLDAPVVGVEFVGTSITSGGDGADAGAVWTDKVRAENPFCKWHNARRGYVMLTIGQDQVRADYRTVPFVSKPDAPIQTASSWVTMHGRPGVQKA